MKREWCSVCLKIIAALVSLYILFKPYYLFASGGLQPADIFLVLASIVLLVCLLFCPKQRSELMGFAKDNRMLVAMIALVLVINIPYSIFFMSSDFLLSSSYYLFNLSAILLFYVSMRSKSFLGTIRAILYLNVFIQLFIWAFGMGRNFDPTRYMGTFNDPNQFGFYILCSLFLISLINQYMDKKWLAAYFVMLATSIILIFLSASTGVFLGLAIYILGLAILLVVRYFKHNTHKRRLAITCIVSVLVVAATACLLIFNSSIQSKIQSTSLFERLVYKIENHGGTSKRPFIDERGYDKLVKYPYFCIFGAGEGRLTRFTRAANTVEVHSTPLSIIFYYGIFSFVLLLLWIFWRKGALRGEYLVVLIALAAECLFLINQRQPTFWFILLLISLRNIKDITYNHTYGK